MQSIYNPLLFSNSRKVHFPFRHLQNFFKVLYNEDFGMENKCHARKFHTESISLDAVNFSPSGNFCFLDLGMFICSRVLLTHCVTPLSGQSAMTAECHLPVPDQDSVMSHCVGSDP